MQPIKVLVTNNGVDLQEHWCYLTSIALYGIIRESSHGIHQGRNPCKDRFQGAFSGPSCSFAAHLTLHTSYRTEDILGCVLAPHMLECAVDIEG